MKQKNQIKLLKNELDMQAIDIKKFLVVFELCDESVFDLKISHDDIKLLIPSLIRVNYKRLIKNEGLLYSGGVIAIRDSFGKVYPYLNPTKTSTKETYKFIDCKSDKFDIEISELIENEELKPYQLKEVCNKLLELRRFKEYKIVKRLLSKKIAFESKELKSYKRKKLMLKENGENEY